MSTPAPPPHPKILLCWGYHRLNWVEPFEKLNGEFEFSFLYYRSADEEREVHTSCRRIYWHDYSSAFEILDSVRPDKVVLMSVDSGYAVALNLACQRRGVPTYILQHGLTRTLPEYLSMRQTRGGAVGDEALGGSKFRTLGFLFRSLSLHQLWRLPHLFAYFWLQAKRGSWHAQKRLGSRATRPDFYICYTANNAQVYRELDASSVNRTFLIGIPEFNEFFTRRPHSPRGEYYMLVDQPWAQNQYCETDITKDDMINMYLTLARYCQERNRKLVVKLHPESYGYDWLPEHPAIEWKRDADNFVLITESDCVFGSNSTLMLPALYYRPCFLIYYEPTAFSLDVCQCGLAQGCELKALTLDQIYFSDFQPESHAHTYFTKRYLDPADGQTLNRLADVLATTHSIRAPQ